MSDIFQEIDEDLRQDKAARLWKAYGKYIVALAIFIILAIASYRFIEHKNEKNREQTSELFELASEAGRTGDKKAAIELFSDERFDETTGYAIISKLKKAALAKSNNDLEGTEIVLKKIITNELPKLCVDLSDKLYEKIMGEKIKGSVSDFKKLIGDDK